MVAFPDGLRNPWLRRFHPAPGAPYRLLCLPHAGGSAGYYFPVSQALSPRLDVLAVQYPGRQERRREPCIDSVPGLADRLVGVVGPWTDRPLILFGHSLGAAVAFELALRLEACGVAVAALFASGRRAPGAERDERVHELDDAGLLADVRALSGTDARILDDEEAVRLALPAIRADYRAAERYRGEPGARVRCPVYALVGDADPKVTLAEAGRWREHTGGGFEMEVFPGGHFYLTENAPAVIDRLGRFASGATPVLGTR